MHLYKLPETNQYIFIKEKSVYHFFKANDLSEVVLIPESKYQKHSKHFGIIESSKFRQTATELLKDHFLKTFNSNQLNAVQRQLLSFLINQFKITKDQYSDALRNILAEEHSFDIQVQLAKYETIKSHSSPSIIARMLSKLR